MTNFLKETLGEISSVGKKPSQVLYVGSETPSRRVSWEEFTTFADFEYDNSYGSAEIPANLIVVFSDGSWLAREEYDGAEWWAHITPPATKPDPSAIHFSLERVERYLRYYTVKYKE